MFKKGYKKQTKGKNKILHKVGKSQPTLIEMFKTAKENAKSEEIFDKRSEEEDFQKEPFDFEESLFDSEANKLIEMAKEHKLNEIVVYFQTDLTQIRIPLKDLRKLFQIAQREVINEYGAQISLSLFPDYLYESGRTT